MKKLILLANAFVLALFLLSCGNSKENTDTASAGADSAAVDSSAMKQTSQPQEYISIPAPDEMFSFMKAIGGAGKSTNYLNNPDNYKNYIDTKSKALNFGIYATDFVYCSTFDYGSEALKYFVIVKRLGDDLGLSGAINQSMADRIKKNIGNNDSLTDISNSLYFAAISDLEQTDKASSLSLVIAGGWIESMNLVTNMVKKYKADDAAIDRIAEQKYTLDNLIGYLTRYKEDANVTAVIGQMNELKSIYDQLKEETVSGGVTVKNGKKILGGGSKISVTEQQYNAISEKVKAIHESFISGK